MTTQEFIATTSRGTEPVLADELASLGMTTHDAGRGAVPFSGTLADGYRACLWSRVASRVLLVLARFPAPDVDAFYDGIHGIPWREHLRPGRTFAVACVGRAPWLRNTHFGALRAKDAVVDRLRRDTGRRPDVDPHDPDLRLHVYLQDGQATLSVDLAGAPLHERDIGRATGPAPLKENLAATVLLLAGWPEAGWEGQPLLDPMCGSGTFLTEAAWMARDVAPGLARRRWGMQSWGGHDIRTWNALLAEARERRDVGRSTRVTIFGSDVDPRAVKAARTNAERAGVPHLVTIERRALADLQPPQGVPAGVLVTNPPYGHRLSEKRAAGDLIAQLGDVLRGRFLGWHAWVFVAHELAKRVGLRPARRVPMFNGPLDCRVLELPISDKPTTGRPGWRH